MRPTGGVEAPPPPNAKRPRRRKPTGPLVQEERVDADQAFTASFRPLPALNFGALEAGI